MPLYTTDALILRTYKLGESDRIVMFLTRDRGKKRGVAKNARQSRRRFGGALEPLTCGRLAYFERERRDLVRLDYVEQLRSPLSAADGEALVAGVPSGPLARYFEYWLLRLQGVYDPGMRMSEDARAFLETARSSSPIAMAGVKVSLRTLRELETAHRELITMHLEKDLKSVRVLKEMRR